MPARLPTCLFGSQPVHLAPNLFIWLPTCLFGNFPPPTHTHAGLHRRRQRVHGHCERGALHPEVPQAPGERRAVGAQRPHPVREGSRRCRACKLVPPLPPGAGAGGAAVTLAPSPLRLCCRRLRRGWRGPTRWRAPACPPLQPALPQERRRRVSLPCVEQGAPQGGRAGGLVGCRRRLRARAVADHTCSLRLLRVCKNKNIFRVPAGVHRAHAHRGDQTHGQRVLLGGSGGAVRQAQEPARPADGQAFFRFKSMSA